MRTLLITGFGDIARRAVPLLTGHWRLLALVRSEPQRLAALRLGVIPIVADLDHAGSLTRLSGLADALLYTAPPAQTGLLDTRLDRLLSALTNAISIQQQVVYISTTGVYGNRAGAWLDECSMTLATSARAQRRLAAEHSLRCWAARARVSLTILRAPGIYAAERLPLERARAGCPLPLAENDSYSNHIHADDLAAISVRALRRRGGIRVYNACDDYPLLMGDWFDLLADKLACARAPRVAHAELIASLTPLRASFFGESRRISNARLKCELYPRLRYPSVVDFVANWQPTLAEQADFR